MSDKNEKIAADAAAKRRTIEGHRDEYERFKKEEMEARGFEYELPLTEEQKAARTIAELEERFPELRDRGAHYPDGTDRGKSVPPDAPALNVTNNPLPEDDDSAEIPEGEDPWNP